MKTTWYLHVHFVWLKLSNSSIVEDLPVCLAAHGENFFDGHCRKRQTSTASPAKPGDLPAGLGTRSVRIPEIRQWLNGGSPAAVISTKSLLNWSVMPTHLALH